MSFGSAWPGVPYALRARGAVADVVAGDPVIARERAGADRGVGAGGHGGERPGERVAVVRALAHQALEVRPVVRPCAEHVPAAAVDHVRDRRPSAFCPVVRSAGQRPSFAVLGPRVVADQRRGGRGEVGERDALGGVAGLDHAGAVGDERHALEVHPDRGVGRARIARVQALGFEGVVRAVERRQQELQLGGAPGVARTRHELHVLGADVGGGGLLHGGGVRDGRAFGRRARARRRRPRTAPRRRRRSRGSRGARGPRVRPIGLDAEATRRRARRSAVIESPAAIPTRMLPSQVHKGGDRSGEQHEHDDDAWEALHEDLSSQTVGAVRRMVVTFLRR